MKGPLPRVRYSQRTKDKGCFNGQPRLPHNERIRLSNKNLGNNLNCILSRAAQWIPLINIIERQRRLSRYRLVGRGKSDRFVLTLAKDAKNLSGTPRQDDDNSSKRVSWEYHRGNTRLIKLG